MSAALAHPHATPLARAAARTFEEMCFLFADADVSAAQWAAPEDGAMSVAFHGPYGGEVIVRLHGGLLPALAANMLGCDDVPSLAMQHDALAEVTNVVCGNLLPELAGSAELFVLAPPSLPVTPPSASSATAVAHLGLEQGRADIFLYLDDARR